MNNMDRFADELAVPARGRLDRPSLGHDVQRAEHDPADARRVRAGLPTARPGAPRPRDSRSRPIHGRRPHPIDHGRPRRADWFRYMAKQHGRSARRLVRARVLGLLGSGQDRRPAARRGSRDLQHDSGRAAPPALHHGVRRPRPRHVRGRGQLRAGLLARRHADVRDERRRVPAGVVQHPRDAARLQRNREMGRVPGEVRRRDAGSLGARPRRGGLAGASRLSRAAADDGDDAAEGGGHRRHGARVRRRPLEAAHRLRLAREGHHDPRARHGRRPRSRRRPTRPSRTASAASLRTRSSGSSSGTATGRA